VGLVDGVMMSICIFFTVTVFVTKQIVKGNKLKTIYINSRFYGSRKLTRDFFFIIRLRV
jgi:hypothetical protein